MFHDIKEAKTIFFAKKDALEIWKKLIFSYICTDIMKGLNRDEQNTINFLTL
jgi:hypothetical protein